MHVIPFPFGGFVTMSWRLLAWNVLAAVTVLRSQNGGPNAFGTVEVVTLSETVPAGGAVQVKHTLGSQPMPITSGWTSFFLGSFSVEGVSLFSPQGDAAGVALIQNGIGEVSMISPNSDLGLAAYRPFLAVTMAIPASIPAGSTFSLGLAGTVFQSPTGPVTLGQITPGTLRIGGSVSVRGVYPGGGTWPAGTVITVKGTGFRPDTKLMTEDTKLAKKINISTPVFVSPTEIRFTLKRAATLDMQAIQVVNPDRSGVTFFSYLDGVSVRAPSRPLLQNAAPLFQTLTHGTATVGPLPERGARHFAALAVQNPTPDPVVVTFQLQRTGTTATVTLPSGGRVMDELWGVTRWNGSDHRRRSYRERDIRRSDSRDSW
jgi:hypothetical protein